MAEGDQKALQHLEWLRETRRPCSTWSGSGGPEGPAALGVAQGDQKALQHLEWLRETSGSGRPEGPTALAVAQGDQKTLQPAVAVLTHQEPSTS